MSKWVSDIVQAKEQRLASGAKKHGHLQAIEGGKIADGLPLVGESLFAKIKRFFRAQKRDMQINVTKSSADEK